MVEIATNGDDATILSLNSLYNSALYDTEMINRSDPIIPLVTCAVAVHLKHETGLDWIDMGSLDDKRSCPIVGITLPIDFFPVDLESERDSIELQDDIYDRVERVLPLIHPCLIQLQPCALLRQMTAHDSHDDHRSFMDILLLRVPHCIEPTRRETSEELITLLTIIEEINGEPMVGATSSVIEIFTVSEVKFISKHQETAEVTNSASENVNIQIPICPVCRYRIVPERLGLPMLKTHQKCAHEHDSFCQNMQFLAPWPRTSCKACQLLQKRLELSGAQPFLPTDISTNCYEYTSQDDDLRNDLKCYKCGMEETLWMCLTCGLIGCGRYSSGHAQKHYIEQRHPFSLELATQRIWDYEISSFIHRDDLLNCPFMQQILGAVNRAAYHGAAMRGNYDEQTGLEFGSKAKKSVMVGEQYEVLLQSALEDQAQHYEGEISHLEARITAEAVNIGQLSPSELKEVRGLEHAIHGMRMRVDHKSRHLIEAQAEEAGHRAKANVLLKEQGVAKQLLDTLREDLGCEQKEGKWQIEELEQQVSDITANIRMREQITNNDNLREAQIFGTSGEILQPKAGRKSRRGRRT